MTAPWHPYAVPVICALVLAALIVGAIHGRPGRHPQPERHVKKRQDV